MQKQTTAKTTRTQRGINLYREHGHEITRLVANVYLVPSCSGDHAYRVDTSLGYCDCPDHSRAKELGTRCKHYHAAVIVQSKRRAARRRRAVVA